VLINLIDQTGWTCIECRKTKSTHRCKLQSVVERLTDQLADVHISLAYMKGEIDELKLKFSAKLDTKGYTESTSASHQADENNRNVSGHMRRNDVSSVSLEIHKTLSDITRRKKNVVVCGLPERCDTTNQHQSDEAAFN